MKKLFLFLSGMTALSAFALFAFYFFKLNPQYSLKCPCCKSTDDQGLDCDC